MALQTSRLDRYIAKAMNINVRGVRLLLAQKRVLLDGRVAHNADEIINTFTHIQVNNQVLQANTPYYLMLHKPIGVVCATKDKQHSTVIDLLTDEVFASLPPEQLKLDTCATLDAIKSSLHIVGRLDLNTSGLVLLTNDSRWSEKITSPTHKIPKQYLVTLEDAITAQVSANYINAFAQGMFFSFEGITTKPAALELLSEYQARLTLIEGRYHQIKRMFGRFQNKVVGLHRESVGALVLDPTLNVGQARFLTPDEVNNIFITK